MSQRPVLVYHEYKINKRQTVSDLVDLLEENFAGEDYVTHLSVRAQKLEVQIQVRVEGTE